MKEPRVRAQFQYDSRVAAKIPKENLKRQVFGQLVKELQEHFGDDVKLKELDSSIDYNQLELELWVFTPQSLSELIDTLQHPEERVRLQYRLHQIISTQSKIKFK